MKKNKMFLACSDAGVHIDGASIGAKKIGDIFPDVEKIEINNDIKIKNHDKENKKKNIEEVNNFNVKLYNEICKYIDNNKILTIGGDHSISIASSLASIKKYESVGIIWIDAHGDYNTFDTTITGNIHGLPLAVTNGFEKDELSFFHNGNYFNPKNTVIVGARDLDTLEKENLINAGVKIFTTEDIKELGVKKVISEAISIASNNTNKIHISYDLDIIDPTIAKGVSIPAIDGIDENTAYEIMDEVLKHNNKIESFDLVEYNPLNDKDGKTIIIAKKLIDKVLNNL